MSDFSIRADSVNVEDIMRQIRARIREKRGVDYTEQQIQELAAVKLERFLDPDKVRSELLQQFRQASAAPNYQFEDRTLFDTHRPLLRLLRRLLRPVLKLFFNPDPLIQALHIQSGLNARLSQHAELSYELLHNLVVETTRLGIEAKNLKMRVESLSSRLDFHERRARALEGAVQYRDMPAASPSGPSASSSPGAPAGAAREGEGQGGESRSRRRRRRRGRRGAQEAPAGDAMAGAGTAAETPPAREPRADNHAAEPPSPGPGDDTGPGSAGQ